MDKKIIRKSASKWDQGSERILLEIWAEKMPQLRGCRKNSHILQEMALQLESHGLKHTAEEIKTKMHNMTFRYRKEKMKIGTTGGSPSEWDLYKEMENLLAPFKSYHSEGLIADSINNIHTSIHQMSSSPPSLPTDDAPSPSPASPPSSSTSIAKSPKLRTSEKKKNSFERSLKSVEKSIEKVQADVKSATEKLVAIEEEKKDILKAFADKEAQVQELLIDFLKKQ